MNLFAYGTLMWPDVLEAVTGRRMEGRKITLSGYKRVRVKDQHYPVILQSEEDSVEGILYLHLTEEEFRCLDAFEGMEYDRTEVLLGEDNAFAYVLSNDWEHVADSTPWKPEDMRPEHLAMFCEEYRGWSEV